MPKFELSKPVEGVKVNKRSGIPTGERVSLAFGAILVDPFEERDNLRFSYLGELVEVKLSEIKGYYKPIEAVVAVAAPTAAAAPAKPVDTRKVVWESIPSSLPTLRAKVPGGWLVAANNGLAFVPDSAHEWDGASL